MSFEVTDGEVTLSLTELPDGSAGSVVHYDGTVEITDPVILTFTNPNGHALSNIQITVNDQVISHDYNTGTTPNTIAVPLTESGRVRIYWER